jgi:hypothetical protein
MNNAKYSAFYKPGFKKSVPYSKFQAMSRSQFKQRIAAKQKLPTVLTSKERKFSDRGVGGHQVSDAGGFTLLHAPTLGSDYTNRVGRKTNCKSLYIRGKLEITKASSMALCTVGSTLNRLIIFIDSQPNGATPAVTDLLVSASPSSQLNANNRDRFHILKDKVYGLDACAIDNTGQNAENSWGRTIIPIKIYKKINLETIFNATDDATISSINSGALYMFWIGNAGFQASEANWVITANLSTRVRFDDV